MARLGHLSCGDFGFSSTLANNLERLSSITVSSGSITAVTSPTYKSLGALKFAYVSQNNAGVIFSTSQAGTSPFYVKFDLYLEAVDGTNQTVIMQQPLQGGNNLIGLSINSSRNLVIFDNTTTTTGTSVLALDRWYRIEVKADNVGDLATLLIDGIQEMEASYTGLISTGAIAFGHKYSSGPTITSTYYIDNAILNDSSGSVNNTWVGEELVHIAIPYSNGATNNWTSSNGVTNYLEIDDSNNNDGDTSYVKSTAQNQIDLYKPALFQNLLAFDTDIITAIAVGCGDKRDGATNATITLRMTDGTNILESSSITTSSAYIVRNQLISETAPDGSPWSWAQYKNLEIGVKDTNASNRSRITFCLAIIGVKPNRIFCDPYYI